MVRITVSKLMCRASVALPLLAVFVIAGCSRSDSSSPPHLSASASPKPTQIVIKDEKKDQRELLAQFETVATEADDASDIIEYLDGHIAEADIHTADAMLRRLHAYYDVHLQAVQDEFYNSGGPEILINLEWPLDEKIINSISNDEARRLANLYFHGGYKFGTAEGAFFPIVDYGYQLKYSPYLTGQMNGYITLMAMQADKPFASDGGIIISWDELADRALLAEQFAKKYPDAPEREEIQKMYTDWYLSAYLKGLVNTPIYDGDSFKLLEEVRDSYEYTIAIAEDSITGQLTKRFMEVLASEDGLVYMKSAGEKTKTPAVMQFHESLKAEAERRLNQP